MKSLLTLAAENLGEGVDVTAEVVPGEVPEQDIEEGLAEGNTEAALAEDQAVQSSGDQLVNQIGQHNQGELIAQAVADINAGIEKALGSEDAPGPGFTQVEAQSVTTALEALRRVVGYGHDEKMNVSLEAFGSGDSRVEATRALAAEASSTLSAIGQGLANAWHKLIAMLRQWVRNATQVGARELKRAETYAKVAASMQNSDTEGKTFHNNAITRVLAINGNPPKPPQLMQALKTLFTDPVLSSQSVITVLGNFVSRDFDLNNNEETIKSLGGMLSVLGVANDEKFTHSRAVGGSVIYVERDNTYEHSPTVSIKMSKKDRSGDSIESEVPVMSVDTAQTLARECITRIKNWIALNKKLDGVADALEKVSASSQRQTSGRTQWTADQVRNKASHNAGADMVKATIPFVRNLMEEDLTILRTSLDYVAGSLRAHRANGAQKAA